MLSYSVGVEESSEASTVSSTSTEFTSVDQTTVSALISSEVPLTAVSGETWSSVSGWTGPCPNLYYSFDVSNRLVLKEGNQEMGTPSIVSGKVTK